MGYGGGTFVKVPPHPLKIFELGESVSFEKWFKAGISDSSAVASE